MQPQMQICIIKVAKIPTSQQASCWMQQLYFYVVEFVYLATWWAAWRLNLIVLTETG